MRYFHRTSIPIDDVLAQAGSFFGERATQTAAEGHHRSYRHAAGNLTLDVRAEGGHYTTITVTTDQVGESEVDKLAKRFLAEVHAQADPRHTVRGAF